MEIEQIQKEINVLIHRIRVIILSMLGILVLLIIWIYVPTTPKAVYTEVPAELNPDDPMSIYDLDYDISNLDDSPESDLIRYGYEVFVNTPNYLATDDNGGEQFAGNRLSCNNCHLFGGIKPYGAPLIGIAKALSSIPGQRR